MTVITGLETFLLDSTTVSQDLKKVFACATALAPLAGAKRDVFSISVQGDIPAKVKTYLQTEWGIPDDSVIVKAAGKGK